MTSPKHIRAELEKVVELLTKYDSSYPKNYVVTANTKAVVAIENLLLDIE